MGFPFYKHLLVHVELSHGRDVWKGSLDNILTSQFLDLCCADTLQVKTFQQFSEDRMKTAVPRGASVMRSCIQA